MPPPQPPIGRERELSLITTFLAAHPELPAALHIEGEAGMGKTTLWRAGVDLARERAFRTLEARPVIAESALAFAALGDLLQDALDVALPALPELQRRTLEAALLLRPTDGGVLDQRAVGVAVLQALRALAADGRLLVAVDDVQWLDAASATTLGYALRRLRTEPVAALFARRIDPAERTAREWASGLSTTAMRLGPLSLGATHALVFGRLGTVVPRPALRRLHELSRGNPFYALELTRAWQAGDLTLAEGDPLPPDLQDLLGARIRALPARSRQAMAVAAALSRPTVTLLAGAEEGDVRPAISRAITARIVELDDDEIRFTHPLLAASAYAAVTQAGRRSIHARLAGIVGDAEERARHLALATVEPDGEVADEVEEAARSAFRRGAPSAAAELMIQALRLTPAGLDGERRRRSTIEAGYRFEAGDTHRADAILGQLVAQTAPGPDRAGLLSRQARVRHFGEDVRGGVNLHRQALREAGDDARLRVEIEEGLAWGLLLVREDLTAAAAHARSAVGFAERLGDDAALAEALAAQAMTDALLGRDADATMARALALEPATLHLRVLRHPSFAHGYLLAAADRLDRARPVFHELRRRAEGHGDESALAPILNHLSVVESLSGDLDLGEALAGEAYDLALQSGQVPSQVAALGREALAQAMRGDVEDARTTAQRSLAVAGAGASDPSQPRAAMARGGEMAIWALGHLCLSLDDHAAAETYLGPLCDALLDVGILEPGELRPLPDRIEALAGLGRLADATRLTERLDAMARATGRPSVLGAAERSRAIVTAAAGDIPGALTAAERAVAAHATAGIPLELARSQLVLGTIQRRMRLKRAARESIEASLASFERLGARTWAARAQAALGRIGGRAPASGQLTPTERRAAELVAEGHSNKEVASLLFVSPKTVEANLSRVYAKLGIQSRTELVRWLAREGAAADEDPAAGR